MEVWADIPGWPNYQVSNLGRVKRLAGVSFDGKRKLSERILKQQVDRRCNNYQYVSVNLGDSKHHESASVARLILLAFVGPPAPGQECRHFNDISTDCRLENLSWGTRLENRQDAVKNRRMATGERNGMSKLTWSDIDIIRSRYKRYDPINGTMALAKEFGVSGSVISEIARGKAWTL